MVPTLVLIKLSWGKGALKSTAASLIYIGILDISLKNFTQGNGYRIFIASDIFGGSLMASLPEALWQKKVWAQDSDVETWQYFISSKGKGLTG